MMIAATRIIIKGITYMFGTWYKSAVLLMLSVVLVAFVKTLNIFEEVLFTAEVSVKHETKHYNDIPNLLHVNLNYISKVE